MRKRPERPSNARDGGASSLPGTSRSGPFRFGAAKRVEREFGRADVLVNNAAFQLHAADIEDITEEHFTRRSKPTFTATFT